MGEETAVRSPTPGEEGFWSAAAVRAEMERVFDICNGCRLCYNLCPSFTTLLQRIDEKGDGDLQALDQVDYDAFVDLCYECHLCYPKCPYTPPHRYAIDVPRLVLRARAVRAREQGVKPQDRFLGETDRLGRLGTRLAPVVNALNRSPLARGLMERQVGVARQARLPRYAARPFHRWWEEHRPGDPPERGGSRPLAEPGSNGRVVLFTTCTVEYNEPETGVAAVQVLEHNGVEVGLPHQRCCGMPFLDGGDVESARRNAEYNVTQLDAWVRAGYTVVSPGPTCSYTLKVEYPWLLDGDPAARRVAEATRDLGEYLIELHRQGKLSTDFQDVPARVVYHLPCHLKVQNIGAKSRDLLRLMGAEVTTVERCSGVDGTWGLKAQNHALSLQVARPLFRRVEEEPEAVVAGDCPLAALRVEEGTRRPVQHPVRLLARAYGLAPEASSPGKD
ncbi:MAG: anaerobic glycerol-3-phosphate dehydrogenase subunit C [Bacillota bacterium]|nr:anaerobic glycerol-3-phosphate dehydrogenase subunit C [Bacillota bacterium]